MDSTVPLEQEASWASRSLAHTQSQDANALAQTLLTTLEELRHADVTQRCEHPAAQLLIGQLAELAGLQFHWPAAAEFQCRQMVARYRAASTCIELHQSA